MPRTKGSKNRPKTNNDYASHIAGRQETIASGMPVTGTVKETLQYYENITCDFRYDSLTLTPCIC